jgi:hypothetical protein
MAKRVFYTFHFKPDSHRVAQVRNMGVIEGQPLLSSNQWEDVKQGGDKAIREWINEQMTGKSCSVVLIGSATAGRKWVNYEIKKTWDDGKGLVGIYIHGLKDLSKNQSTKGANPFAAFTVDSTALSSIVKAYDPPYSASTDVYNYIANNVEAWIDEAIAIRKQYL